MNTINDNAIWQRFLNQRRQKKNDNNEATFRGMVVKGGNYYIDLNNENERNEFIKYYSRTDYWKRVVSKQSQRSVEYDENNKSSFLVEVRPPNKSRFYVDIDNITPFTTEEVTEKIMKWSNKVAKDSKVYILLSVKSNGEERLHVHWTDIMITPSERLKMAISLESYLGVGLDLSVYSSGLRLPGCFKGRNEKQIKKNNPIDTAYYSFYRSNDGSIPSVEELILTPHPLQEKGVELNWEEVNFHYELSQRSDKETVVSKKRKRNHTTPVTTTRTPPSITTTISENVWERIERFTQFKGPFTVQGKGSKPNSWIIDYNHDDSFCTIGNRKHDHCGLLVGWNPDTDQLGYLCLAQGCRSHHWTTVPLVPLEFENHESESTVPEGTVPQTKESWQEIDFDHMSDLIEGGKLQECILYLNDYLCVVASCANSFFCRFDDSPQWIPTCEKSIRVVLKRFQTKQGPLFEVWQTSKLAKLYKKVRFYPCENNENKKILNLWNGRQIQPSQLSAEELLIEVDPWVWHAKYVIAKQKDNDPASIRKANYLLQYLAHIVQKPWIKTEKCIVMQSRPGAGKNVFFKPLQQIFGDDYFSVVKDMDDVFGGFNSSVITSLIVIFDEVVYAQSKRVAQRLKTFITDNRITVKKKFINDHTIEHFANCFIFSNYHNIVQLDPGDRRYIFYFLNNIYAGIKNTPEKKEYFNRLANVKPEHILQYLLSFDLTGFDLDSYEDSTEHLDQLLSTLDSIDHWFFNLLSDPPVDFVNVWSSVQKRRLFYDDFKLFCAANNSDSKNTKYKDHELYAYLSKFGFSFCRTRVGNDVNPSYCFDVPSLHDLRASFSDYLKKPIDVLFP